MNLAQFATDLGITLAGNEDEPNHVNAILQRGDRTMKIAMGKDEAIDLDAAMRTLQSYVMQVTLVPLFLDWQVEFDRYDDDARVDFLDASRLAAKAEWLFGSKNLLNKFVNADWDDEG